MTRFTKTERVLASYPYRVYAHTCIIESQRYAAVYKKEAYIKCIGMGLAKPLKSLMCLIARAS